MPSTQSPGGCAAGRVEYDITRAVRCWRRHFTFPALAPEYTDKPPRGFHEAGETDRARQTSAMDASGKP